MRRIVLIIGGVLLAGLLLLISPFVYDGIRSGLQSRALENRTDFPQIAAACDTLLPAVTNDVTRFSLTDPRVPPLLRSLSPRRITAFSDQITLEFHGGEVLYGYRFRQDATNLKRWTLYYYTGQMEKPLTTIVPD